MTAPFEKFRVKPNWLKVSRFRVEVFPISCSECFPAEAKEREEAQRQFIDTAIREKLARDAEEGKS